MALAAIVWNWFASPDVEIVYTNSHGGFMDGFWAVILTPFVLALVVISVIFIAFGVAAAVFVAFAIAGFSLLFAGLSIFWPVILAIIVFYWLFSDSKQKAS